MTVVVFDISLKDVFKMASFNTEEVVEPVDSVSVTIEVTVELDSCLIPSMNAFTGKAHKINNKTKHLI